MYDLGRVLGCSSILYGAFTKPNHLNVSVIAGMAASAFTVRFMFPSFFIPEYLPVAGWVIPVSGLLVGVGTKLGSGCTSGHMLIGLARRSLRSLVAAATFTSVAMATAYIFDTAPSSTPSPSTPVSIDQSRKDFLTVVLALAYGSRFLLRNICYLPGNYFSQILAAYYSGFVFGLGLIVSGMASPGVTLGFLALPTIEKFNPSLLMVVAFGLIPNAFEYYMRGTNTAPTCVEKYSLPTDLTTITPKLVIGSAIFGVGWGLSGICPGPGVLSVFFNGINGLLWLGSFLAGYGGASFCF